MERPAKLPLPLERNAAMRQRVCKGHHIIDTHSRSKRANISRLVYPRDTHIREKNVLQPSSLLLFCLLFFCFALSSVYHRPILEEGRIEKMEFPDVSSFPCPSPYRGCGGWQFGNRIHHLMRSFHPSTINIAEGSIFRLLGKKILEKFLGPILRAPPSSIPGKEPYVTCFPSCSTVIQLLKWQGCHENDYFSRQIFKGGCKNEGLMQYKCMEKEIRKLHGRVLFPSVMYIANIPAGMQL